jgi:maltose alpha-D-glucosyltransferase/alpha-amylase
MGDNVYLGDRNGVRTPMQWSPDRNGGFSRANPAQLYSPLIMDAVYGYEAVNVEAQQSDPSSLLNWMRNMIALRKLFRVFGRGSLQFLDCANGKVLAYLRQYEGEQVLCVANLSRFAQPVELDLARLEGMIPVEMLGFVEFPAIKRSPYPLTLSPYGFLWFELHPAQEPAPTLAPAAGTEEEPVVLAGSWQEIVSGPGRQTLETKVLPEHVVRQRWFGGKSRQIDRIAIIDSGHSDAQSLTMVVIEIHYLSGPPDRYFLPVAISFGNQAEVIREKLPGSVLCAVARNGEAGVLHDASASDSGCAELLRTIEEGSEFRTSVGLIRGVPGTLLSTVRGATEIALPAVRGSAEQSNTSIIYGDRLILKIFRRYESGPNPDCEISRYLAERTQFAAIPPFAGSIEYAASGQGASTLAMLQGLVPNQGDGWKWTLEELNRFYERASSAELPASYHPVGRDHSLDMSGDFIAKSAREHVGFYVDSASLLGRRTAEMHMALASPNDDPDFTPEPVSTDYLRQIESDLAAHAAGALDTLKDNLARLPDEIIEPAGLVLSRRRQFTDSFRRVLEAGPGGLRTRIHGDYHLGPVLRVKNDYVILDFEGEPARSLEERRTRHSPLKDVAGMLRSFSYAAWAGLLNYVSRRPVDFATLEPWAQLWEQTVTLEFLRAYGETAAGASFLPPSLSGFRTLTEAFLIDKALYELQYELNNRPEWVRIPLRGILSLWT